jgi:hypothetical protein
MGGKDERRRREGRRRVGFSRLRRRELCHQHVEQVDAAWGWQIRSTGIRVVGGVGHTEERVHGRVAGGVKVGMCGRRVEDGVVAEIFLRRYTYVGGS